MKKLRAAVVGVGYLGNFHAQKFKNNPHCELVAVCDANPVQAQKIATDLGVAAYSNPKDLVGKVDLVTIATSTRFHFEVASLFVNEGIAVNVEKPMTATLEQAEKLYEICEKRKSFLTVGHVERFNPSLVELNQKIAMEANHFEFTRWTPFRMRGSDVSVVFDLMVHDLDMMFWLTQGGNVKNHSVRGDIAVSQEPDTVNAYFDLSLGSKNKSVYMSISRASGKALRQVKVYSPNKTIVANTGTHEFEMYEYFPSAPKEEEKIKTSAWTVNKVDALQEETNHFIDCVLNNKKPQITAEDGLQAMIWADKIDKQIRK
ncbi:MAG: Gfo/Idh/MocA family oxidoreductase [Bdellovibrionaceae bacterium]|nr:Gfo/Idh/MocA family oxidoreductase [Pseudobdellovibrionaceae bacterium]